MTLPPSAPEPATPAPGTIPPDESKWSVGTLAYTRHGLVRLFSWLLWGDLAWSIRDRTVPTVLQLILKQFQASDRVAGALSGTIPAAIGLILGPIVSIRSDNYRGPRGRRIPFLLISAPAAAVAILGLGFSPKLGGALHHALGSHSPGHFPSVLIVLALWWVVFDFATTVTNAIFGALINDTVPHLVIGRFYGLFRAVSLLVGIIFNYWLLEKAEIYYQWVFAVVAAIYGVGVVLMCLRLREGEYPPPPPVPAGGAVERFLGRGRQFLRRGFTQPYYLWYYAAFQIGMQATGPINLYSVFYSKSIALDMGGYGKVIALTYVISFSLSYLLGWAADKLHPLRLSIAAIALYGIGDLFGGIFISGRVSFGAALLAHGVLSGTYFTATSSLGQRLLPKENFAQFSSASGLVGALLSIVVPMVMGTILDWSGHQYRLTYYAGAGLSAVSVGCYLVFYRLWKANGCAPPADPPGTVVA